MVDHKMCLGLSNDKKTDSPRLMCRVGPENYEMAMDRDHCTEMDLTGRAMKGFVFVNAEGFDTDADLAYWIQL